MTNKHTYDSVSTYDRLDIDSLCMEAMRNDTGYYNDDECLSSDASDIVHTLEALCDTL